MSGEYKEPSERVLHERAVNDKITPPACNLPKTGTRSLAPDIAPPSKPAAHRHQEPVEAASYGLLPSIVLTSQSLAVLYGHTAIVKLLNAVKQ